MQTVLSFRRLFGGDVDPALKPVLFSVGFGALGQFAFFAFFAIWALTELDAEATEVGLDRKSTRLNSSHESTSRMPSSA